MTDPSAATSDPARKDKKESLPVWQESLLLLAIALVLAVGIKFVVSVMRSTIARRGFG